MVSRLANLIQTQYLIKYKTIQKEHQSLKSLQALRFKKPTNPSKQVYIAPITTFRGTAARTQKNV